MPRTTLKHIAQCCGVSTACVGYILSDNPKYSFRKETIQRVKQTAREMDYRHNPMAASLRKRENRIIMGVVGYACRHSDIIHLKQLERAFGAHGYNLLLQFLIDLPDSTKLEFLQRLINWPAGIVVWELGIKDPELQKKAFALFRQAPPSIDMTCTMPGSIVDYIRINWQNSGQRLPVEYFARLGRQRVACCMSYWEAQQDGGRFFYEHAKKLGLSCSTFSALRPPPEELNYFLEGREIAARILQQAPLPQALYCTSDELAFSIIEAFHAAGVRVPEDVLVVGGGDSDFANWYSHPLPHLIHDIPLLINTAVEDLLQRIERGDHRAGTGRCIKVIEQELKIRPDGCSSQK